MLMVQVKGNFKRNYKSPKDKKMNQNIDSILDNSKKVIYGEKINFGLLIIFLHIQVKRFP